MIQSGVSAKTLAGWRVFMPELAFQAGIPREHRRYLGRWQHEAMADNYTREHRTVVTKIWRDVCWEDLAMSTGQVWSVLPPLGTCQYLNRERNV